MSLCLASQNAGVRLLARFAVLGCKNLRGDLGTTKGAVNIAERMVVIVVNAEVL